MKRYGILLVLLLACFLRVVFLDRIPTGMSFDELEFVLNAKAVWVAHSDIGGKWNPLSLTTPSCCFPMSELSSVVVSPLIGPFPFSLPIARIPYVLTSIVSLFFLYLIAKKILTQTQALVITLIATVNPWDIFFARTAYDAPLSTLFLLVSVYLLLITQKWKILFVAIPFFLAFFTYIGTKVAYPFYLLFLIPYICGILRNKKDGKWFSGLFLLCLIPLLLYFVISHVSGGGRFSEISSPNQASVIHDTNAIRQLSLDTPTKSFFVNKYLIFTYTSFEKYLGAFNPNFLFFHGDNKFLFTVWYTGAFYYTDAIFFLLGWIYLFATNKKAWGLMTGLLLLAPIPSVVSNVGASYATRSFSMLFPFCFFIGVGLYASAGFIKKQTFKKAFALFITIFYLLQIANFFFIYIYVNPVANSESFAFSNRLLARYLTLAPKTSSIAIIQTHPQSSLKQYIFYRGNFDNAAQSILKVLNKNNSFSFDNITFTTCNKFVPKENEIVILESGLACNKIPSQSSVAITRLSDAGSIFTIYHDRLCSQFPLNSYPQHITLSDLAVEKLSPQRFCQQFIMKF